MSDGNLWGPWIDHDGKGCPCVGKVCRVVQEGVSGETYDVTGVAEGSPAWDWSNYGTLGTYKGKNGRWGRVIRYRIRKPRALLNMIERAREIDDAPTGPVRTPAKEVVG